MNYFTSIISGLILFPLSAPARCTEFFDGIPFHFVGMSPVELHKKVADLFVQEGFQIVEQENTDGPPTAREWKYALNGYQGRVLIYNQTADPQCNFCIVNVSGWDQFHWNKQQAAVLKEPVGRLMKRVKELSNVPLSALGELIELGDKPFHSPAPLPLLAIRLLEKYTSMGYQVTEVQYSDVNYEGKAEARLRVELPLGSLQDKLKGHMYLTQSGQSNYSLSRTVYVYSADRGVEWREKAGRLRAKGLALDSGVVSDFLLNVSSGSANK